MVMNMSTPWTKVFFSQYFQIGGKHLDVGTMKQKNLRNRVYAC